MNYYRLRDSLAAPKNRFSKLARIIKKLDAHRATMRVVQFLLPENEADHCTGARVQGSTLFMTFDSNAWATRARFRGPTLLEQIKKLSQFAHVDKIVIATERGISCNKSNTNQKTQTADS